VRTTVLGGAGVLAFYQGDFLRAAAYLEEGLALARAIGDQRHVGWTLHRLGRVTQGMGDSERAAALGAQSVDVLRRLGEPLGLIAALIGAGIAAQLRGDAARATALCGEAVALLRDGGDRKSLGHECLRLLRELGTRLNVADCYERLVWVAHARGQPEQAARLLGAAEALRAATGTPLAPVRRGDHDAVVAAVRAALDEATLAAAWAQGQALSLEEAAAYALEDAPAPP
jgi:tetratricopeptide (TPR) repeat protein